MFFLKIILTLSFFSCLKCQVLQLGLCPNSTNHLRDLEIKKLEGRWYEVARFPQQYIFNANCSYKDLSVDEEESSIQVEEHFVSEHVEYVLHYNYSYDADDRQLQMIGNTLDIQNTPLSVVETDYDNFAIVYGCTHNEELQFKYVYLWVLSRTTKLKEELHLSTIHKVNQIPFCSTSYLEPVYHTENECYHRWTADLHQ